MPIEIHNKDIIDFFERFSINPETFLLSIIQNFNDVNHDLLSKEEYTKTIDNFHSVNYSLINDKLFSLSQNIGAFLASYSVSSKKGQFTENNYIANLSKLLPMYSIENTSGIPHSMDVLLKTNNKPDIRIDLKNYSINVPTKEILKFHNDILYNKCHGILVSDCSGIVSHSSFSFDIINNKYIAFYLTHNQHNYDNILHIMNFIYSINDIINKKDDAFTLSQLQVDNIQFILKNFSENLIHLKSSLQTSISLCNKMSLEQISHILSFANFDNTIVKNSCINCNKNFKNIKNHKCKQV